MSVVATNDYHDEIRRRENIFIDEISKASESLLLERTSATFSAGLE